MLNMNGNQLDDKTFNQIAVHFARVCVNTQTDRQVLKLHPLFVRNIMSGKSKLIHTIFFQYFLGLIMQPTTQSEITM